MSADRASHDFGSRLREARERRGVSLRDIAKATKISVAVLDALERNDISKLPGGIFSRSFVRSYAVEVGLDPETTIQEFIAAFPHDSVTVGHPASDQVEDTTATESERRIAHTIVRLLGVSLPILALLLYLGTAGRRRAAPPDDSPAITPAPPPAVAVGEVPPAPAAALNPPAVPDRAPAPATDPAPLLKPPAATATASADEPRSTDAADLLTIGLSVRTPCVVSAIVDGRKAIDQVLRPGDRRTIEVRRDIMLTVGDASAVVMTLNGADARPLGKAGDVVTVRLTLANFKEYLSPR